MADAPISSSLLWSGRVLSRPWLPPLILVLILGGTYALTLLPGPGYVGDTTKFQFVGYVLGTAHEPGYPTYTLLNHVFVSLFPFGSIAFRANLLSAIFSLAAVLIFFRLLLLLGYDRWIALIATLCLGLGYTVWSQSVIAEVYTLNLLFIALVLFYFIRWHLGRREIDFFLACGFYAFSFGNHLTMMTFLPAIVLLVWLTHRRAFIEPKRIGIVALLIVMGAAQYSYVFWRYADPGTPYLEMAVPDLRTFFYYITGGRFQWRLAGYPLHWMYVIRVPLFAQYVVRELLVLLPVAVYGIVVFGRRPIHLFLLVSMAGNILFSIVYAIPDIFVYLIPTYVIVAIYVAEGLTRLAAALRARKPLLLLLLSLPLLFLLWNFPQANQRSETFHEAEVDSVLKLADRDALIICPDYHYAMLFYYKVFCEEWGRRGIQVAFYHDEPFPASAIGRYILEDIPLSVVVTRTRIAPGLRAFLYAKLFELDTLKMTEKEYEQLVSSRVTHSRTKEMFLSMLGEAGLEAQQRFGDLYELLPHRHASSPRPSP